jgi:protein-L-isoaspartate(D-aspartate) O-methyltransferase
MEKEDLIKYWLRSGIVKNEKIIEAFRKIPREKFVLKKYKKDAYADIALSIKAGQTISQPTTVVMMLNALELKKGDKVLEIGSGSGYNACFMAEIVGKKGFIYSTEIIKELVLFARKNIKKLKLKNIKILNIDGSKGYFKEKPFDRIIITAGCPKIPDILIEQLKERGIIVAPVGDIGTQKLVKCKKIKGNLDCEDLGLFRFVPLKGKFGWK